MKFFTAYFTACVMGDRTISSGFMRRAILWEARACGLQDKGTER